MPIFGLIQNGLPIVNGGIIEIHNKIKLLYFMKKTALKKLIFLIALIVIFLGLLSYSFRTNINVKRFIDKTIYSSEFHYLECDQIPKYEISKTKFDEQKAKILALINKLELEDLKSVPAGRAIASTVLENEVVGNFIRFKLDQICGDRAEINVNVTEINLPEIKNFLNQNLSGIPYNLIND